MAQKANSVTIDIDYLTGWHHKTIMLSEVDRIRYLALWGLAKKLGRELLPSTYNGDDLRATSQALRCTTKASPLKKTLLVLCQSRLIVLPVIQQCKRIAVVGLADRYPTHSIDRFDPSIWFGSVWISSDRIGSVEQNASTPQAAFPPTPFRSSFPEIIEILTSIDAKGYRTLKPSEGFDRDLDEWVRVLGRDRVIAEAKAMRTWLDGKFQTGQKRRDARHNPQSQFINWLKKAETFDKEKANGISGLKIDEFGRRETPTGRILRLAREEQTRECERTNAT